MVNFEKTIKDFFAKHNIDINNSKVVIAVSTGVDSMVLLDLISKYTFAKIVIAHVNHGKRSESKAEEEFICKYAKENDVQVYVYHIQKDEIEDGNFQEEARKIRYSFFKEIMVKEDAHILLLAHHLNDDIETMLFRLQRGSNLSGYAGINDIVSIEQGIIARPLLGVLKKDILEYAKANNIKYFEDCTNNTDDYSRNKIRHHVVPEIFDKINDAEVNFIEMKNNIKNASIILNDYRNNLIRALVKCEKDGYSFVINDFLKVHEYMQKEILFELTKEKRLSSKHIEEILKVIKSKKANIATTISDLQVIKSYDEAYLFMSKLEDIPNIQITINDLSILEYNVDTMDIRIKHIDDDYAKTSIKNCYLMNYNYNLLPLCVRTWQDGDKIITKNGTKKVSRILIDNHVSLLERRKTLVVCKENDILMVVGYQKSLKALEKYTSLNECNMTIEFLRKRD